MNTKYAVMAIVGVGIAVVLLIVCSFLSRYVIYTNNQNAMKRQEFREEFDACFDKARDAKEQTDCQDQLLSNLNSL